MSFEIINGDCLEAMRGMADDAVDAVVTSPPYNTLPNTHKPSGLHAERRSGVNKWIQKASTGYADQRDESEYQEWLREVITECLRVSRGLVWVNHKPRYRDGEALLPSRFLPFPVYSEVVWDRGISMALNCRRFAPSHEVIYGFGRPHYWNDDGNTLMSVWRISPQYSDLHPCPFPTEIPRRLIRASVPKGGTVLDPFAGSFTTGEAAIIEGRNFIGIEQSAEYCAIGEARMRRASGEGVDIPRFNKRETYAPLFDGA